MSDLITTTPGILQARGSHTTTTTAEQYQQSAPPAPRRLPATVPAQVADGGTNGVADRVADEDIATLSRLVTQSTTTNGVYTTFQAEELREAYLRQIELPDWKERFHRVGEGIRNALQLPPLDASIEDEYVLKLNDSIYTFSADQTTIMVGRKFGCDLQLRELGDGSSRLHIIIYRLADRILVVDPGSLVGVKTIKRNGRNADGTEKHLDHSLPRLRMTIQFAPDESFTLKLGQQEVTALPKICILCESAPRQYRNHCGHYLMCQACAQRVIQEFQNKCPVCHGAVSGLQARRERNYFQSFVPFTSASDNTGAGVAGGAARDAADGAARDAAGGAIGGAVGAGIFVPPDDPDYDLLNDHGPAHAHSPAHDPDQINADL